MCKGTVTLLRCPHLLVHVASHCGNNCGLPTGPRFKLDDTCANCHPSYRVQTININHDLVRSQLMAQLRVAIKENRAEEQQEITRQLTLAQNICIQGVLEAKQLRVPVEGVIWPGKVEEE